MPPINPRASKFKKIINEINTNRSQQAHRKSSSSASSSRSSSRSSSSSGSSSSLGSSNSSKSSRSSSDIDSNANNLYSNHATPSILKRISVEAPPTDYTINKSNETVCDLEQRAFEYNNASSFYINYKSCTQILRL